MDNDNLMLNLVQGTTLKVKKKKKIKNSKKKFLKNKISKNISKDKSNLAKNIKPRKQKIVKEINLNKEISAIQQEFSSGLDEKSNRQKVSDNTSNEKNNTQIELKSNANFERKKSFTNNSNKIFKSKEVKNSSIKESKEIKNSSINKSKEVKNSLNNKSKEVKNEYNKDVVNDELEIKINKPKLEVSIIDNEFSDGLTEIKKISQNNKRKSTENNDFSSKKFNSEIKKEKKYDDLTNNLKSDFNKLFSNKNDNSSFKNQNDKSLIYKKEFISDCFKYNPDIPNVKLKSLKEENKEEVFDDEDSLKILKESFHPYLVSCLSSRLNIDRLTTVQTKSIPLILKGHDCLIKSVTGSGKTFTYVLPIIQNIKNKEPKISRTDGLFSLIIVPTRELVLQCYEVFEVLCKAFTYIVPGYLMGGENKHSEKNRIRKGINILVSTPGRLLDHISTTKNLSFEKLEFLVIDEADKMYEAGFEESIKNIVSQISQQVSSHVQTVLLSATLNSGVKNLAGLVLKNPKLIDTYEEKNSSSVKYTFPKNLKQLFTFVPAKLRLITLSSFIFDKCSFQKSSKILVFMSTQDIVDFHYQLFNTVFNEILSKNEMDEIEFFKLHGNMEQKERMSIYKKFVLKKTGVLICTDVAARGLNLKDIEFVIQFSCPPSIENYVHRIGRTARIEHKGSSIIFLLPSEINFLSHIQKDLEANLSEIKLEEILKVLISLNFEKTSPKKCYREHASKLQYEFENSLLENDELLDSAKKAYLSYVRAYATYPKAIRDSLSFKDLHLGHLCKSFCLRDSPKTLSGFRNEYLSKKFSVDKEKQFQNFKKQNNYKQKNNVPLENRFSEFDSGF